MMSTFRLLPSARSISSSKNFGSTIPCFDELRKYMCDSLGERKFVES